MALSKALKSVHDTLMRSDNHLQVVGLHRNTAGQWKPTELATQRQHASSCEGLVILHNHGIHH